MRYIFAREEERKLLFVKKATDFRFLAGYGHIHPAIIRVPLPHRKLNHATSYIMLANRISLQLLKWTYSW